jgi:hypothetical protein
MNLETIANISQIASAATIVGGTVFGLLQISEYRKQRRIRLPRNSCAPS